MKSEEAEELIKAIRLLTHEVQMLGHGNAVQTDPTRQFGAVEMLGMKVIDTLNEQYESPEMRRRDWFAAFVLCGMVANGDYEIKGETVWKITQRAIEADDGVDWL